jgi:hypothetical protein
MCHSTFQQIVKNIDLKKHPLPAGFEHPAAARARKRREMRQKKKEVQPMFNMVDESSKSAEAVREEDGSEVKKAKASDVSELQMGKDEEDGLKDSDDEAAATSEQPTLSTTTTATAAAAAAATTTATAPAKLKSGGAEDADDVDDFDIKVSDDEAVEEEGEVAMRDDEADEDEVDDDGAAEEVDDKEEEWEPIWVEVRKLFKQPDATPASELTEQLKWGNPDEPALIKFLVEGMQVWLHMSIFTYMYDNK